jgi:hypothetical protein
VRATRAVRDNALHRSPAPPAREQGFPSPPSYERASRAAIEHSLAIAAALRRYSTWRNAGVAL